MSGPPTDPPDWPDYCCAILRDPDARYLLERRPLTARHVGGQLTCFGGRREPGEDPEACIRRELREELGWEVGPVERCVRLVLAPSDTHPRLTAWFYRAAAPTPTQPLRTEPGVELVWATSDELAHLPLSPLHSAAIEAERRGDAEVHVPA